MGAEPKHRVVGRFDAIGHPHRVEYNDVFAALALGVQASDVKRADGSTVESFGPPTWTRK